MYNAIVDKNHFGSVDSFLESILLYEGSEWSQYKIRKLNEDEKSAMSKNIVTRLWNDIKNKILHVDFAPVDVTKGDITKLKNYSSLENAIKYLEKISAGKPELNEIAKEFSLTMSILKKYKTQFENGFRMNQEYVRFLYNSAVIALIQGTSFTIAESVDFVKDSINLYKPEIQTSRIKNIKKNNHIISLAQFNELERKGKFIKLFKESETLNESILAGLATASLGIKLVASLGLVGFSLTFIRGIVFSYYNARVKLSQYLKHLEEFVNMNASTLGSDAKKTKE